MADLFNPLASSLYQPRAQASPFPGAQTPTFPGTPTDVVGGGRTPAGGELGGSGGHIPIISDVMSLINLFKRIPNPFHHDTPAAAPATPTPTPTPTPADPAKPAAPSTGQSGTAKTVEALLGLTPVILSIIGAMQQKSATDPANNPAGAALGGLAPDLAAQISALLHSDVQRRQMSDPLYQAVLQGAMGGLPVWMRQGVSPITAPPASPTPPQV